MDETSLVCRILTVVAENQEPFLSVVPGAVCIRYAERFRESLR
jgi:hypothetical protein